jgi:uncharacterized protein (TIGR03032 family)
MKGVSWTGLNDLWNRNDSLWRNPAQVAGLWEGADTIDPQLLEFSVSGRWWETLESAGITLIVSREYEHLLIAMGTDGKGNERVTSWPIPHPSGLAVDRQTNRLYVASTRNPNQIFEFLPACGQQERKEAKWHGAGGEKILVPVGSRFFPGCLYIHDIALIGRKLHANSVGNNSVVLLRNDGRFEHVWWPRCIEKESGPSLGMNYIQLNSIAAGNSIDESFFSASSDRISSRRPGHRNFPVQGRGVIFSGKTGEPVARGLTRPHSARLHQNRLWVANSGYGEMGLINDGKFEVVVRLNGWTRGLCFHENIAFLGTSRVIPRFSQYAPGLNIEMSKCGIYMVDVRSGESIGSLIWPHGNQVFSIEWLPAGCVSGFPLPGNGRVRKKEIGRLFSTFKT